MTPRERVLAALARTPGAEIPFSWGFGTTGEMGRSMAEYYRKEGIDWDALRHETDDIVRVSPAWTGPAPEQGTDFWGIQRKSADYGGGAYNEVSDYPLAGTESAAQLSRHPWPDPESHDFPGLRETIETRNPGQDRATMLAGGNPFEIYCWMTGLEESLMNLVLCPDVVREALERITTFFTIRLERALTEAGDLIDLVFLADDLGSQTGLLVSRDMYREFLQPFHRRLTNCVHRHAPHVRCVFHSDGAVFDVLPDLIDAGIDVLEAVQTDAEGMDPARLKQTYGDRLAFHGGISVQQLLPKASPEEVADECRRLIETLGRGGGYIPAPSHAIQVGTPPGNVDAMLQAVLGPERYPHACERNRIR